MEWGQVACRKYSNKEKKNIGKIYTCSPLGKFAERAKQNILKSDNLREVLKIIIN